MTGIPQRLAAVRELMIAEVRETAGMHEYDGVVQDLSGSGVRAGLAALAAPPPPPPAPTGDLLGRARRLLAEPPDPDERGPVVRPLPATGEGQDLAHLSAFENGLRWYYGEYEAHRRDPMPHLNNLDLACYDREYAAPGERGAARAAHLALWPDAIDVAVRTLDAVPAPVAEALLPAARGLAGALDGAGPPAGEKVVAAARTAHGRLVAHLEGLAATGDPDCSVGERALARSMGAFEACEVDLEQLAELADAERDRLRTRLAIACTTLDRHRPTGEVVRDLLLDHPTIDGVLAEARAVTREALEFTREHGLAPWTDGECLVGPAPRSRRWAMAMMSWAGPEEPDAPSWYHVTPPEPGWPAEEIAEWLSVFSRTTLPAITVHEVAPGHYAHSRSLRRLTSPVRRQLIGATFAEGWAHYVEEVAVEEGFRAADPRYAVGVCLEALVRVTRLVCSIALHTGRLDVDGATERFRADAFLGTAAARSEARRGTFDIGYGRYTLGKLAVLEVRERARRQWGEEFSLPRLHGALLELGSPPIGLLDEALR